MWDDLMVNAVTILTVPVTQSDEGAGVRGSPAVAASAVPCSIQDAAGDRSADQGREGERVTHRVYFATNRALKPGSLLRPTVPAGPDLYVLSWLDPTAGTGSVWSAECESRN